MKDKITKGLFKVGKFLKVALLLACAVVVIVAYHFGLPYLVYKFIGGSYSETLAIWFAVSYVTELWENRTIKKQLKTYKEIDEILKGRI